MLGQSPLFREALDAIRRAARFDVPVLLEGETGTGKELAARAIHYGGERSPAPFVPLNCGALAESLIENELFGHQRGAFTDARTTAPGIVKQAHRGTLFLDEIDALSPRAQVALLRFLQDNTFRPLGAARDERVDVRLIAASNRSLAALVARGVFRSDLLFRIKLVHVVLPPLRERPGDAQLIAESVVRNLSRKYGTAVRRLSPATLDWFDHYSWPGNVRELEHVIHCGFLSTDDVELDIPPPVAARRARPLAAVRFDGEKSYAAAKAAALDAFNREFLTTALTRSKGNISLAASMIRKDRRVLRRLLQRYDVNADDYRSHDADRRQSHAAADERRDP